MPNIIIPADNRLYFNESIALKNKDILEIQKAVWLEAALSVWFIYNKYEAKAGKLTFAERKVNFTGIAKKFDTLEAELLENVKNITAEKKKLILKKIKKAVITKDFKALEEIKIKFSGKIAGEYARKMKEVFEYWKKAAADELKEKIPGTNPELKGFYTAQATQLENKIATEMSVVAKDEAFYNIAKGVGTFKTLEQVEKALDLKLNKIINASSTQAIGGAFNTGRLKVFETYPEKVYGFQYTAVLDHRTTNFCNSMNGRTIAAGDPAFSTYQPPNHVRCRSMWVAILKDEFIKPKITTIPKSLAKNSTGYTNFKDLQKISLFKPTAAATTAELEILKNWIIQKAKKEIPKKAVAITEVVKKAKTVKEVKTIEKTIEFKPVKTRDEAITRLEKHFNKVGLVKNPNLSGVNEALEAIELVKNKYKFINIPEIDLKLNSKTFNWQMVHSVLTGLNKKLRLGIKERKQVESFEKYRKLQVEYYSSKKIRLQKDLLNNPQNKDFINKLINDNEKDLLKYKNFKEKDYEAWSISSIKTNFTPIQNTTIHELGHAIDNELRVFHKAGKFKEEIQEIYTNLALQLNKIKQKEHILTRYAKTSKAEHFAESFAAYENGLYHLITPEVKKSFDNLIKFNQ